MTLKKSTTEELQKGDLAPDFELKGTDGERKSLDSFKDKKALLVVFTCNHCPYAKAKMPVLNQIAEDYEEVAVVGINSNDSENYPKDSFEKMQELVEKGKVDYDAYLRDESQEVARDYGAVCTPDPFLFKNDGGEFRLVYHGRLDDALDPEEEPDKHHMREVIEKVINREKVEKEFLPSQGCSIKWKD